MAKRIFWFGEFEWDTIDAEHEVETCPFYAKINNDITLSTEHDGITIYEGKEPYAVINHSFMVNMKRLPDMMKLTYKSGLYEDIYSPLGLFLDFGNGRNLNLLFVWFDILKLHIKYQTIDQDGSTKQTKLSAKLTGGMNQRSE